MKIDAAADLVSDRIARMRRVRDAAVGQHGMFGAVVPATWLRGVDVGAVPDGWRSLVRAVLMVARQRAHVAPDSFRGFRIVTAKEKFAQLALTTVGGDDKVALAVERAVAQSRRTCTSCGRPARQTTMNGRPWTPAAGEPAVQVVCSRCRRHHGRGRRVLFAGSRASLIGLARDPEGTLHVNGVVARDGGAVQGADVRRFVDAARREHRAAGVTWGMTVPEVLASGRLPARPRVVPRSRRRG